MHFISTLEGRKWYKIVFLIIIPILSVIGLIFTFYTYFNNKYKELSYEIGSVVPITNLDKVADTRIKVFFEDKQVSNISLMTFKFTNTGNQAIDNSDFKKPLLIKTKDKANILAVNFFEATTTDLAIELSKKLKVDGLGNAYLKDVFLNPKDSFSVSLIISDLGDKPLEFDYRIKDISRLHDLNKEQYKNKLFIPILLLLFNLIMMVIIVIITVKERKKLKKLHSELIKKLEENEVQLKRTSEEIKTQLTETSE